MKNKTIIIGLSVAVIMLLFPPWRFESNFKLSNASSAGGYAFILSAPTPKNKQYFTAKIDTSRLFVQLAIVGGITAIFALRKKKEA